MINSNQRNQIIKYKTNAEIINFGQMKRYQMIFSRTYTTKTLATACSDAITTVCNLIL